MTNVQTQLEALNKFETEARPGWIELVSGNDVPLSEEMETFDFERFDTAAFDAFFKHGGQLFAQFRAAKVGDNFSSGLVEILPS